jgi:dextranase
VKPGNWLVTSSALPISESAQAGMVWAIARGRAGADVWHLINLLGNTDGQWLDSTQKEQAPPDQTNAAVRLYYEGNPTPAALLHFASPDLDHGEATTLPFSFGSDDTGTFVETTIPRLRYWDMLWLDKTTLVHDPAMEGPWAAKAGSWTIVETTAGQHQMQVNQGGGILKWVPGLDVGDYSVEGDVTVASTIGNGALLARMQLDGGFYQVEIKSGTTWAIYKHDGASDTWRELKSGSFNYAAGSTHHLKLTLRGSTLRADIDQQFMGTVRDVDHPFYRGTVGLRSESQQVSFDTIVVHANYAAPFSGPPPGI